MPQLMSRRELPVQVVYQSHVNGIEFDVPKDAKVNEYFAHPQKQSFLGVMTSKPEIEKKLVKAQKSSTVEIE
mgnify:FL=1